VSDRRKGWEHNYRIPDVAVVLAGSTAKDCGAHWHGGPDIAVEIVSPGEDPRKKLDFYAKVRTRELLVLDRSPWGLELYRLKRGKLASVGRSDATSSAVLASAVLPLTFQLQDATPRPTIRIAHTATGQTWTA
jgi:Uma2 family endonuclease